MSFLSVYAFQITFSFPTAQFDRRLTKQCASTLKEAPSEFIETSAQRSRMAACRRNTDGMQQHTYGTHVASRTTSGDPPGTLQKTLRTTTKRPTGSRWPFMGVFGAKGLRPQWSEHVGHIALGSQGGVCREKGRVGGEGFTASTQTMEHINSLAHVPLLLLHFLFARATSISQQRPKVHSLPILPFKISFAQFPNVHFHPCMSTPFNSSLLMSSLPTPPFHIVTRNFTSVYSLFSIGPFLFTPSNSLF